MTSIDVHLRNLVERAREKQSHRIVDDAFSVIQGHYDRFNAELSPELLILFAEVASDLQGREEKVIRALELYDRLRCSDDQFKARALLVRCTYEARLGAEACRLKGQHLLQQLKYALTFLSAALSIATRPGNDTRYGFLVSNASLVFWEVARPMCRQGWQCHLVKEAEALLAALRAVAQSSGSATGAGDKGKGVANAAVIPAIVGPAWLVELSLNLAFGYEDANDAANAQKSIDAAAQLLDEMLKQEPLQDPKDPRWPLRELVWNARAHFARKQPDKVRQEINAASGGTMLGTVLFLNNGGIVKEKCEDELIAAWTAIDTDFDLREAVKAGGKAPPPKAGQQDAGGVRKVPPPQKLVELALGCRAACTGGCFPLAYAMLLRLDGLPVPAGRGRVLLDLSRAELEVWRACQGDHEDPKSGMLLEPGERSTLEADARQRALRLCEQCAMAAKRVDDVGLVEESAVVLWNLGRELLHGRERLRAHKSMQTCADILAEVNSTRLVRLRVQLHLEVAFCEVTQDLLTKGAEELQRAQALDYTAPESELGDATKKYLEERAMDPAKHIRSFDEVIDQQRHLLSLKTSLYDEPDDPADQVMLLLDQVQKQKRGVADDKLTVNMLQRGFAKLEAALDELLVMPLEQRSSIVERRPLVVDSSAALRPLRQQAPAAVKEGGPSEADVLAIRDQKQRSDREAAVEKAKRLVTMMCRVGLEAGRVGDADFAIRACDRAIAAIIGGPIPAVAPRCKPAGDVSFGPPPIEVEGALLLAEAAYSKAQGLAVQLAELGIVNGLDEDLVAEAAEAAAAREDGGAAAAGQSAGAAVSSASGQGTLRLSPEERVAASTKKRELIAALLYGMELSCEFEQWWMVANGLVHWWNLHLGLVELSQSQPQVLAHQALPEYLAGLKEMQAYFWGDRRLPNTDFRQSVVANLVLAHVNASVLAGQLGVLEADQLLVVKRLQAAERRDVVSRVTELCRANDKPTPDLAKLRPERLDGAAPAAAAGKAPKGAPPPPPPMSDDKTDFQGYEADVAMYTASLPWAKDSTDAQKNFVDKAVELLNRWEPNKKDEGMLTLWVRLWTALGRQCLGKPMNANVGAKYALMCGIKGLGAVDAPTPKNASQERLRWRGACHALCGEAFQTLVDPQRQERDSLESLRRIAISQFERCCDYALCTSSKVLAVSGATSLWKAALPLLQSAETRQTLVEPLHKAARALAEAQYREDMSFLVDIFAALFDCYSDAGRWDQVHDILNEAFKVVPSSELYGHRRLWALRMLALSKQGKDVAVAMGKMKESQARAQARIWMVLANASSKQLDQLNAYTKAVDILQTAQQPDVVEVRIQFADWLLRNSFSVGDAQDELSAAADLLLEIEEDSEEEEEDPDSGGEGAEPDERDRFDTRSHASRKSRATSRSEPGSPGRRSAHASRADSRSRTGSKSRGSIMRQSSAAMSSKSLRSTRSKAQTANADENLPTQLGADHYEALCRIFAAKGKLGLGKDAHHALLAAAHFAIRFFSAIVGTVNSHLQRLAESEAQREEGGDQLVGVPKADARPARRKEQGDSGAKWLPTFVLPPRLQDWASEKAWPWSADDFATLLEQAIAGEDEASSGTASAAAAAGGPAGIGTKGGTAPSGNAVGSAAEAPSPFAHQGLSFHALVRLQDDLEEHGYQLWALPVLALQLQLARACSSRPALQDAVACLAHMRLSRFASECRLRGAAATARAVAAEELDHVRSSFSKLEEELEEARQQRQGSGAPDADWLGAPGRSAGTPWLCGELRTHEVWAELAKECLLHGEMWMACKLAAEGARHAQEHGDRRALRALLVVKARTACLEGRPLDAVRVLKQVTAADARQAADLAIVLAEAYRGLQQQAFADEVLDGALKALAVAKQAACDEASKSQTNEQILAECMLRTAQLHTALSMLSSAAMASYEWMAKLDAALTLHREIAQLLLAGAFHRRRVATCIDVMDLVLGLIEDKRAELVRLCAADGDLNLERLEIFAADAASAIRSSRSSRDELVAGTVPAEGAVEGAAFPGEVLAARLDVREASAAALQRSIAKSAATPAPAETPAGGRCSPPKDEGPDGEERIGTWLADVDGHIAEVERVRSTARQVTEVEAAVALVSNASAVLSFAAPEASAGGVDDGPPACAAEALVELGRLQLELAERRAPPEPRPRWADGLAIDSCEAQGMEVAERLSNVLHSRDPGQVFDASRGGTEGSPEEAASAEEDPAQVPFDRIARATLCNAVQAALQVRHFAAARRGLQVLAFDAYGNLSNEATFEFLALLQSTNVCMRAQTVFSAMLPEDHGERVQLRLLHALEHFWSDPRNLGAHQSTAKRLQAESPLFRRLELARAPSVKTLLLTHLPPLTLVVTLQLHEHRLYVGAVCTPPEGEAEMRKSQMRHFVMRMRISELRLRKCAQELGELNAELEKELIATPELNAALTERHSAVLAQVDELLTEPVAQELVGHFWPHGAHLEHPGNPRQMLLLPDSSLWDMPLERSPPLTSLFGKASASAISRDLSLHIAAQRVQRFVEATEGDAVALKVPVLAAKPTATVLLTDPFHEDALGPSDDPKSETMCAVHERLTREKVIGNEEQSVHGRAHAASPEDIQSMLADSSAFYHLGFGRFFNMIRAGRFASQDLRHVALLALFNRAINDSAFRRQTKTNSARTPQELAVENSYSLVLIAAFRGIMCTVQPIAPVPAALALRCMEAFAREVKDGKTVAKAMERSLGITVPTPELHFARPLEGGLLPGEPAPNAKADPKAPKPEDDQAEPLPAHTRRAFVATGAVWLGAEADQGGRKR